jgi:nitrogen fixation protein FixH
MARFTGWHMMGILFAFFGVVIAVNLVMATLAVRTFGGTVVDNTYVASQEYNRWLAAADRQHELGWDAKISRTGAGYVQLFLTTPASIASSFQITGFATHPLGREPQQELAFRKIDDRFVSVRPIPPGRWHVHVAVQGDGGTLARFEEDLRP